MTDDSQNHERFLQLFLRSEGEVLRYVMALVPNVSDAQDVVQNTAVALWRKFDEYDPSEPFTPWACRFALHEGRAYMRKHRRWRHFLDDSAAERLASRREQMSDRLDDRRDVLRQCLEDLPARSRSLIDRYYFQEKPVDDIAGTTGRSVDAIYKALQRIREKLLECINRKLNPDRAEP